jgi:tetratricopeptide (TPR) repeat protein
MPQGERTAWLVASEPDDRIRDEALKLLHLEQAADGLFGVGCEPAHFSEIPTEPGHIGEIIGHYRLVEQIGRGGMGAVYRAISIDTFEKSVAVKLIDATFGSEDLLAHFRTERQILANLEHPNIARLLDGGARADGTPYLIMEFVEGISPYDYCTQHNLSIPDRLLLFRQICNSVHFAHQNMVIHRDLKPANILVTADGTPKLLDFGIAKVLNPNPALLSQEMTVPSMRRMSVRYASPEQVRGEPVSSASDVYSLGVILYELLAGHSPYGEDDLPTHQMMTAVCDKIPARPSIWVKKLKGDLDNIVLRALKKSPQDRYASADQFSEDIQRYLEGRPVIARGEAPLYVAARFIRRNRIAVTAAALVLVALVAGLIDVSLSRARADRRFNQVRLLAHSVMFDYADAIDQLPGSTPIRSRMVKDALTYLDTLSKEADTPELQQEIVNAYVHVSNVQGNEYENNLGDTAAAMQSARKAVAAAGKLLRKSSTPSALDSAASAFSTYGALLYSTGDLSSADPAYLRAIDLRRKLAAQSPNNVDNQVELASCLRQIGDLYGGYGFPNLGKTTQSQAFYNQSKVLTQALANQFPNNLAVAKERYETLISISDSEAAAGNHPAAARDLADAVAQIQKVSLAEPHDTNIHVEHAIVQSRLGQMLLDDRNPTGAIQQFSSSAALLQTLLTQDPGNALYRRGQSVVENQWAAALRGAGQTAAAITHSENALRLSQSLAHDSPNSAQYTIDVATAERKLSDGLLAAGDAKSALHHADIATQTFCHTNTPSTDSNTLSNCDRSLVALGNANAALHNAAAAVTALRKATTIATALHQADPPNPIFTSDNARAQSALGSALAASHNPTEARIAWQSALDTWSTLRQNKTISAEDAYRATTTTHALESLSPH